MAKYQQMMSGLSMSIYMPMSDKEFEVALAEIVERKKITADEVIKALADGATFLCGPDFHGKPGTRVRDAEAARWAPKPAPKACRCRRCGETNPSRFTTLPAAMETCDDCA